MFRLATPPDISERELVERCQSTGDVATLRAAQRMLYERYKRAMFSTAYRITNDPDHANDVLQDAFVDVFRSLDQFAFRSTLGAWIKTIVVRQAIRKQQLEGRFLTLDEAIHDQPAPFRDTLTGAELDAAIRTLPGGARTIFLLAEVEGYAHKEIAQMLGVSEGTSKSQVSYAKKLSLMRYSYIMLIMLLATTAQAQTDSTRTEYKTEDESISKSEVKRFIRYITRANVEEKTLIKVGIWPATDRNTTYEDRVFRAGANLELSIERKLSPSFSLIAGLTGDWRYTKYRNNRNPYPIGTIVPDVFRYRAEKSATFNVNWKAGMRYYYNMNRRIEAGQSANNFSGNYLTTQISKPIRTYFNNQYFDASTQEVIIRKNSNLVFGNTSPRILLAYGIQRRLGRLGYLDVNLGPELLFSSSHDSSLRNALLSVQLSAIVGIGW